jgi:intein/homing endonuclease
MKNDFSIWELVGILIGDGNLWSNRTHWRIEVTGDKQKDRSYLLSYVKPLFENYTSSKIIVRKRQRALRLRVCSKELFHILTSLGLKQRREKILNLSFLKKLDISKRLLVLRGLVDTDGSVYKNKRGITYVQIATVSEFLAKWIKETLEKVNFKPHISRCSDKRPNRKDVFRVYVYGPLEIERWLKIIGFSNKYKLNKALKILFDGAELGQ